MLNKQSMVYWDACVFQSYIEGIPDRLPVLDAMLQAVQHNQQSVIVTSTVSITEVAYVSAERANQRLRSEVEQAIDTLWAQRDVIWLIEYSEHIAKEARQLIRASVTKGWRLRSHDAVHLASAKHLGVARFYTYDRTLFKYSALVDFPIGEPQVDQPSLILPIDFSASSGPQTRRESEP
jgi:predicted nucleic acid-binding protein